MFCSKTSGRVYLAARSGDRSSTPFSPKRRVEGGGAYEARVWANRLRRRGWFHLGQPINIRGSPFDIIPFSALWLATVPLVISMCGPWRRMGSLLREARMGSAQGLEVK
jgi:hypothetical protein